MEKTVSKDSVRYKEVATIDFFSSSLSSIKSLFRNSLLLKNNHPKKNHNPPTPPQNPTLCWRILCPELNLNQQSPWKDRCHVWALLAYNIHKGVSNK